ncbi:MFS transporter [Skeletonema marinoi]|uniref:MFS transporter n=2 Tax=Skeletonema marinoi TaxID=267567 RepID=A0AAD9D8R6_9STRA|nr:MFS transporter [Skeletonema marinoi]
MSHKTARVLLRAAESFSRPKTSLTSSLRPIICTQSSLISPLITSQSRRTLITLRYTSCRPLSSVATHSQLQRNGDQSYCHRLPSTFIIRPFPSATTRQNSSSTQSTTSPASSTSKNASDELTVKAAREISTDKIDRRTIYELLKLSSFTNSELHWRFDQIIHAGDRLHDHVHSPLHHVTPALAEEEERLIASPIDEASNDNSKDADEVSAKDSDSVREIMHIQDLEAYIYERYLHIDDQWKNRYATTVSTTLLNADASTDEEDEKLRLHRIRQCAKTDATSIFQLILENAEDLPVNNSTTSAPTLTKDQFQQSIQTLAKKVQYSTILPLATSMLLVGSSVGVISPIMPFLADKLDLTTTLYGIVVSSFALSKMLGNVPSAILVERHGRKPYLVHSLWAVGLGVAGMGLATDWMQLSVCRMIIGLGVASLTTASTLTVADSSTPLSRARTFSPLMGAFAAGMAIGPAIGGILCDTWGIQNTFFAVSSSYCVASIWNHFGVNETKRHGELWEKKTLPWHSPDTNEALTSLSERSNNENTESVSIPNAVKDTTEQWTRLLADKHVRPIVIMNGFYMSTFAAAQLTLLPLLLTGGGTTATGAGAATGLALSATAMGQVYMWMSINQVLSNPIAGQLADRSGKSAAIVAGGTLTSLAVASVPLVCSYGLIGDSVLDWANWPMLATLSFWSLGGTLLATAHVAAVSDEVNDSSRSQAIALLRTSGDVGYLCGAACAGISADLVGDVGLAMQAGGAVFLGATTWFGFKSAALNKLYKR